uniref:Uncharacterized protein n=1 Tax=Siphoviridae sp. ct7EW56 TaxID=2827562 RepID=A0A8S5LS25_9CAUD|nr:MAG TPA: hypothetical protein [Siphoviridae sp. ct7EW56]
MNSESYLLLFTDESCLILGKYAANLLLCLRLPIPPRINSHVDGFRETQITNNLFPFSVYM